MNDARRGAGTVIGRAVDLELTNALAESIKWRLRQAGTPPEMAQDVSDLVRELGVHLDIQRSANAHAQKTIDALLSACGPSTTRHFKLSGTIYVAVETSTARVKVGFTSKPVERRIAQLQTGSGRHVRLLSTRSGTEKDERAIHRDLRPWRTLGEWYLDTEDFRTALAKHIGPTAKAP